MNETIQFDGATRITIESPERQKGGVRSGLRDGELRVTCVLSEEQNDLLHAWACTTGRTFREVTMAMADAYIKLVIKNAVINGVKLVRDTEKEPPAAYAEWYEDEPREDKFADYF